LRICIVGDADDLSAAYIRWLAEEREARVLSLREDRLGLDWSFGLREGRGAIDLEGETFDLDEIAGAFVRLNSHPAVDSTLGEPGEAEHVYAIERRYGLHWLLDEAPFPVVNRPSSGRSNGSTPFQMLTLARAGLQVPRWVATNRVDLARAFVESCPGGAVYKSCSAHSHVHSADELLFERLRAGTAPLVIQEDIAGGEARVHVVGEETFATRIASGPVDHRLAGDDDTYEAAEAPQEIAALCTRVARDEGLLLAGLDFQVTAGGEWLCLELDPVPTFLP
jgi:hypothetical protein